MIAPSQVNGAGREMPHSPDAEENLIGSIFADSSGGADVLAQCEAAGISKSSFYDVKNGIVFACISDVFRREIGIEVATVAEELRTTGQLDEIGGVAFLMQVSGRIPTTAQASYFIERVREQSLLRELIRSATGTVEDCYNFSGGIDEFVEVVRQRTAAPLDRYFGAGGSVIAELAPRRAGCGRTIPEARPIFYLKGVPVFTRANIGLLTALEKAGKSSLVSGLMGAAIAGESRRGDTLRLTAANPEGHALIHFDTEQSPQDHEAMHATALRRADAATPPPWLYSYGVKGWEPAKILRTLKRLLREAKRLHGGILAVIIDGVADLVIDVNDPKECGPLVTQLEAIATDYDCAVIGVLHLNPAPANQPTKSRGHLGSQLQRKCETDLRLVKDSAGVTTIYTACARHAPIFEKDGPRFSWDASAGMHLSLEQTKGSARDSAEIEALRDLAADLFGDRSSMRYSDLISGIESTRKCSERSAGRKFQEMRDSKVIERFPPNLWAIAS